MHAFVDSHVHLIGIETDATGCWLHPAKRRGWLAWLIRRWQGLPAHCLKSGLEHCLLERIQAHLQSAPGLHIVLLPLDWARNGQGHPQRDKTDLYVPNDFAQQAAATHPRLYAGASIHPFRPDAIDELHRVAEAGAVLVKWLPVSQGFRPDDPRCLPFFDTLTKLGLPLLVHTGSEGATRLLVPEANDPLCLRPALEAGVTVIAAHAGMSSLPHEPDRFCAWRSLLTTYPNLYGDTAAWFALRTLRAKRVLRDELACSRLLHGSDWPVPGWAWWWWLAGHLPLRRVRALAKNRNPLLQDRKTKRALGLPEDVFTRAGELLQLPGWAQANTP